MSPTTTVPRAIHSASLLTPLAAALLVLVMTAVPTYAGQCDVEALATLDANGLIRLVDPLTGEDVYGGAFPILDSSTGAPVSFTDITGSAFEGWGIADGRNGQTLYSFQFDSATPIGLLSEPIVELGDHGDFGFLLLGVTGPGATNPGSVVGIDTFTAAIFPLCNPTLTGTRAVDGFLSDMFLMFTLDTDGALVVRGEDCAPVETRAMGLGTTSASISYWDDTDEIFVHNSGNSISVYGPGASRQLTLDHDPIAIEIFVIGIASCFPGNWIRGDANGDQSFGLVDPLVLLGFLFLSNPTPACADAADANDDGQLGLTDALAMLQRLFVPGTPSLPSPNACGDPDPTADSLDCSTFCF